MFFLPDGISAFPIPRYFENDAQDALNNLKPTDTETNMYSAIIAAREFAKDSDTRVTIISDFRNTEDQEDWHAALKAVQATGAVTNLVQVGGKAKNVGIVSVDAQEDKTRIGVTNFEDQAVVVNLKAGNFEQPVPLAAGATDYVTISTPAGITQVTIDPNDDFPLDDTAYIANNQDLNLKLLVVTNNPNIQQTPFWYGLQSISDKTPVKLQIDVNNPPALVTVSNYDVVFFVDVDPTLLVQRIVRETADQVKLGKAAVIMYQQNLWNINYEGMLSYTYNGTGGATAITPGEFSSLTKGIDFGDAQTYYIVSGSGQVLAQAADGTPMISLVPVGKGKVLYYGVPDSASSFPYEPYYPVFWKRALDALTGKASLDSLNYKTGATAVLPGALGQHPDFNYQGFLDKQGLYTFGDYTAAANLESQAESKVSIDPIDNNITATSGLLDDTTKQKELTSVAMLLALILLFIELFFVKFRGDF